MTNPPKKIEEWERLAARVALEACEQTKHYARFSEIIYNGIKEARVAAIEYGKEVERREYREHLCFVYRWISRLNGDKSHDTPEKSWRTYVSVLVNYPLSPWQTGDWFEGDVLPANNQS